MDIHQALMLVREKYLEEQKGILTGPKSEEYGNACKDYPAMMTTAHLLWAFELSKNSPS